MARLIATIRSMPVDCRCRVCSVETRNAVVVTKGKRIVIQGFVCDECMSKLPYAQKRI